MPKVSVVIPVYNAEKYLGECLRSVLSQTLRDIEVICVNDASTDGSLELLRSVAARDDRIRIIDKANQGAAVARNAALDQTSGDYVAFMDADDLYPSADVLERLYDAAVADGALLCGGCMEHLQADGSFQVTDFPPYYGFTTYLYSRQLLADGPLRFPIYGTFEDPPFLVAAMAKAGKLISRVDFPVYRYRVSYRPPEERVNAVMRTVQDYVRGLTDVVRISREANLTQVYDAVRSYCYGQEFFVIGMRAVRQADDVLPLLCRLNAAFSDDVSLPVFRDLQRVYRRSDGPWKTLVFALWQMKAQVGAAVPKGLKFWIMKVKSKSEK